MRFIGEEEAVRELGDAIGYGRLMQLTEQLWAEANARNGVPKGAEHAHYCCVALLVPCVCVGGEPEDTAHCDWCCGAGRVTKAVHKLIAAAPTVEPG